MQVDSSPRSHHNRATALGFLSVVTFTLTGCLSVAPIPTPTADVVPSASVPTFITPTINPTATFTPEFEPTGTPDHVNGLGSVLYEDNFDQNLGWETGLSDIGGASFIDGRLSLTVNQSNSYYFIRSPAPSMTSFFLEVSMRSELCTNGDEFGVMYRVNNTNEHYRFVLTCDGEARVSRLMETGEIALIPITQTYAAFPGLLVENQIGVWADGNNFRFFINSMEVFTARDGVLKTGGLALFVRSRRGGHTKVSFDKLIARSLLPTPIPTSTTFPSAQP